MANGILGAMGSMSTAPLEGLAKSISQIGSGLASLVKGQQGVQYAQMLQAMKMLGGPLGGMMGAVPGGVPYGQGGGQQGPQGQQGLQMQLMKLMQGPLGPLAAARLPGMPYGQGGAQMGMDMAGTLGGSAAFPNMPVPATMRGIPLESLVATGTLGMPTAATMGVQGGERGQSVGNSLLRMLSLAVGQLPGVPAPEDASPLYMQLKGIPLGYPGMLMAQALRPKSQLVSGPYGGTYRTTRGGAKQIVPGAAPEPAKRPALKTQMINGQLYELWPELGVWKKAVGIPEPTEEPYLMKTSRGMVALDPRTLEEKARFVTPKELAGTPAGPGSFLAMAAGQYAAGDKQGARDTLEFKARVQTGLKQAGEAKVLAGMTQPETRAAWAATAAPGYDLADRLLMVTATLPKTKAMAMDQARLFAEWIRSFERPKGTGGGTILQGPQAAPLEFKDHNPRAWAWIEQGTVPTLKPWETSLPVSGAGGPALSPSPTPAPSPTPGQASNEEVSQFMTQLKWD